jgi:hypothetical protein
MKKLMQVVLVVMIAMSLLGLAGCGKAGDPKSLAKQAFELSQKSMETILKGEAGAAEKLAKDSEAIQKKVEALSDADKKIFQEELAKLMGDAYGADDEDEEKDDADEK